MSDDSKKKALIAGGIVGLALLLLYLMTRNGSPITYQAAQDDLPQATLTVPDGGYSVYNIPDFSFVPINPLGPTNFDSGLPPFPVAYLSPLPPKISGPEQGCCNTCSALGPLDVPQSNFFNLTWVNDWAAATAPALTPPEEPAARTPDLASSLVLSAPMRIPYLAGEIDWTTGYLLTAKQNDWFNPWNAAANKYF